jgi:non-specific serine/threonine protein kinase
VELASLSDPARLVQAAATALNVREQPGAPLLQTLVNALQYKTMLLVLDNCEHLLAASGELAACLLRGCPSVKLLVTSRERLGIAGEQMYRVPSMSLPDIDVEMSLESIKQYESVRLFEARACLVCSDFRVNQHNAAYVARACHRLDGIPLAIELAAARVRSLSVEELQHRLDDRFHLLTGGDRSAMPRQQTLRGLIDWSYDLLFEPEKRLLQRLSVFAGGWTLQAAEAVGGNKEEVLDLLTSLVDKSMVQCEEREDAIRYRLLETMRHYAHDRLMEDEANDEVRTSHRDYYLALAELAEPQLQGVHQAKWLRKLEEEHENLRAALAWSLEANEESLTKGEAGRWGDAGPMHSPTPYDLRPAALRFCGALQQFWQTRGHLTEGRDWCDRALASPVNQEQTKDRARVVNGAGVLARMQCDFAAAQSHLEESLDIYKQIGDLGGIASSLIGMGNVAVSRGDNASARSHYQGSLNIYRQIGDRRGAAGSLIGLGIVGSSQGDYTAARSCYEESLKIMKEIGSPVGIARTLSNLGNAAFDQADYKSARAYYQESLTIEEEIGNRSGIAHSLGNLGNVAWSQADYEAARAHYQRSLTIKTEIGDLSGIANTLNNLGAVSLDQGEYASAQGYFNESLTIYWNTGDRKGITAALDAFAGLATNTALFERAALLLGAAETLREEIGSPRPPNELEKYNIMVSDVRRALGGDVAFDTAWGKGRAMEQDEVIALAMTKEIK